MPTIPARLLGQARRRPSASAYFEKSGERWVPTDWKTYAEKAATVGRALMALGLEDGGRVCILGGNRSEWVLTAVGGMMAGGVPAGIYQTCSSEEIAYIVGHAGAPVVVVEDGAQLDKVNAVRDQLPELKAVVLMAGTPARDGALSWDEFLARAEEVARSALDARLAALQPDRPATFIYTSGTTGPPKAVTLTHRNLTWTADVAAELVSLEEGDCSLSYLPLSHIAEQMFTVHGPISTGSVIYFAQSREQAVENLLEVQPTLVFGVPRVWEKMHAKVSAKLADATGAKAKIAAWAMGVGRTVSDRRCEGRLPGGLLSLKYKLASRLLFDKVKPAMGLGRARVCISGAAPISPEVLRFFTGLDLVIHEVYGQSEGSGPTSFNRPGRTRLGTVGPPIPGVEVRIAEDGEICLRGPNVFAGYFGDAEATAATILDGWLHSGDLGSLDADGFLKITGRKKEIIITAGGKNITPVNIESALRDLPLVSQAVVIGDRRRFLSALITLDPEGAERFASEHGLPAEGLHENAAVLAELERGVESVRQRFARVEHVRKYRVLPRDLDQEHNELTPTLKIRRRDVTANWSAYIEGMYAD